MADVPFLTWAFPATDAPTSRTMPNRLAEIKNVKDFGAVGDGVTDDTTAINNAIISAATLGTTTGSNGPRKGGIVFFPPGNYVVSGALYNDTSGATVTLVGSGIYCCCLVGDVTGFIIDQSDARVGVINRIEGLTVINNHVGTGIIDATVGAVRFNNSPNGSIVDCLFTGHTGLSAYSNTFNATIRGLQITGCKVGAFLGQVGVHQSVAVGNYYGFLIQNAGCAMVGCRTEACVVGTVIGWDQTGAGIQAHGVSLSGFSTERCDTAIYLYSAGGCEIHGGSLSATIGVAHAISNMVYSAGTVTVTVPATATLDSYGWTSGTKTIKIESSSPSGFNSAFVTGTRTSSTTFTYASADPGSAYIGGATWSFKPQYGLRMRGATDCVISAVEFAFGTACEQAGVDLYTDGNTSGTNNALIGLATGSSGWLIPPATMKASFAYVGCDQPGGSTTDNASRQSGMNFADLPGQSGVSVATAKAGMQYYIVDGNQATVGGSVTAGGGSNKSYVVFDGSAWKRAV